MSANASRVGRGGFIVTRYRGFVVRARPLPKSLSAARSRTCYTREL